VSTHKVLVIDDSRVIRVRVREMLPENSFEILEAKDGLEGIERIREDKPSLIMLDFLLPKMSGWEVFQALQQEEQWRSIPLVVMSGRKEEVLDKLPEPFEYFSFIEKPFDQKQLAQAIREAMIKSKKRAKSAQRQDISSQPESLQGAAATQAEIQQLRQTLAVMQAEITTLKKQMVQLVRYIKQKL
jgi:CheY-like chemotaxis protein